MMASFSSISRLTSGCARKSVLATIMSRYGKKSDALFFGTAFHSSLEHGLQAGINELRKNGLQDQIDLLTEMWKRQTVFMTNQGIDVLDNELPFEIEIEGTDEVFRGFIDSLIMWRGEIWLGEYKTARFIDVDHVSVDSQITSYLWACRETGLAEPKGVLYFVNQKSMDKPPVVLASGHLSTAKNQGCTYNDYVDKAIEIYGEDIPPKVEMFMTWLEQNEQPKLVMVATKRTEAQLDAFGEQVKKFTVLEGEMKATIKEKGNTRAVRETNCWPTGFTCRACDYRSVCFSIIKDDTIEFDDMDEVKYNEIFGQ